MFTYTITAKRTAWLPYNSYGGFTAKGSGSRQKQGETASNSNEAQSYGAENRNDAGATVGSVAFSEMRAGSASFEGGGREGNSYNENIRRDWTNTPDGNGIGSGSTQGSGMNYSDGTTTRQAGGRTEGGINTPVSWSNSFSESGSWVIEGDSELEASDRSGSNNQTGSNSGVYTTTTTTRAGNPTSTTTSKDTTYSDYTTAIGDQEFYFYSSSKTTLYQRQGTTKTADVDGKTITIPTTTATQSWTEYMQSMTTSTSQRTGLFTTTSFAKQNFEIEAHTVYELEDNDTIYFLKKDAPVGIAFPRLHSSYFDIHSGMKTLTRTPADQCTKTFQLPVVNISDAQYPNGYSSLTETNSYFYNNDLTKEATVFRKHSTTLSSTTEMIKTGKEGVSGTYTVEKQIRTYDSTTEITTASVKMDCSVDGGIVFISVPTTSTTIVNRGATYSNSVTVSVTDNTTYGHWYDLITEGGTREETIINGGSSVGFFSFGAGVYQNNVGTLDFHKKRFGAWATVGDGTTATAEPKLSWDIQTNLLNWDAVSIIDGVETPWPHFGVETTSTTIETAQNQTASTTTATATTAIWGNVFRKKTSSSNSSGVTTSVNTYQIEANGNGKTILNDQFNRNYPTPSFIAQFEGSIACINGMAYIADSRTIIALAGIYDGTTLTNPKHYSGSNIPNTYLEKTEVMIVLPYAGKQVFGGGI